MAKAEIPFSYGELVSITGTGSNLIFWFKEFSGNIRGVKVDISDPSAPSASKDEIIIKRKTEGQTRKKKLPPVGTPVDTSVLRP